MKIPDLKPMTIGGMPISTRIRLDEIESLLDEINPCLPPYMEMRREAMGSYVPGVRVILALGLWRREFILCSHEEEKWDAYGKWCERFVLEQIGELAKQYTRELLGHGMEKTK